LRRSRSRLGAAGTGNSAGDHALQLLQRVGRPDADRPDNELLGFEKPRRGHDRRVPLHPAPDDAALLTCLGAYLKDVSLASSLLVAGASVCCC